MLIEAGNTLISRPEYPRPEFRRKEWLSLNGAWDFGFDDERAGEEEQWYMKDTPALSARTIQVPFAFQSKLSGIEDPAFHDVVWYRRSFEVPEAWSGKRIILHFGAVDYLAKVWVNGQLAVMHEGGHTPFQADITPLLVQGSNRIVLRAEDFSRDVTLPRGKQYWLEQSASIFYTRTTGIWQSVWLEPVSAVHMRKIMMTPDIDRNEIRIRTFLDGFKPDAELKLRIKVTYGGEWIAEDQYNVGHAEQLRTIGLGDFAEHGLGRLWSPEHPNLYDIEYQLVRGGETIDEVAAYFGMRKVSVEDGRLCLNNRPYYQRLVLDQGYFPDGILTAPSDEALKRDVELAKEMGFNGVRKHQKTEDPRFLYWCDKLGLLVWSEAANAYEYSEAYVNRFTKEWQEIIGRDYNHPSIVTWVPLNESWGIPNVQIDKRQQQHGLAMYHLTKSLDDMRPVVYNDGWEHMTTDLITIHDYESRQEVLEQRYATAESAVNSMPANRKIFVGGASYQGQPILISEFGGIAFKKSEWEGWGYSGAENEEDFLIRLKAVVDPMFSSPVIQGYCYTQLTDVEQEINGLLTYDRKPKAPLAEIRKIMTGK
ncbi:MULTISPECIES: sugar-binding domain-containing protein [unclassified Paenibacillus]|uniref:glycoside hydrolase family 2 protein n=1 Tax=unclassified Paenibacillus TaxID=185978 RepID=UPI0024073ABD|nr:MULTISPECIES: sugar-binding domain-containing protein [unclassified Paenibacillus]MDF9843863.1 beta-galactosidase/beta-glucuronidase [Paenibacillus sp. PastF-2]MDF9850453.1 beta-galactosidase/beta-glucuronidase [Paenibacillus sp. PastM-2]MDF9857042.1 beta-galactosidase/beta-glucuronidase [Paenibacillus sp. PastF-1]MDH6482314.1 beta-galactosidase/beta-glucuronidase [Paenibacillus sp. PastH-2]MDH6509719.1 beta-galactosidase/beta-glucuronidase [Paenibacillus sp. PastM-3]